MFSSNSINPPSATDESDRRDSHRQCVDYSGLVITDSEATHACRVLNVSAGGALLQLEKPCPLPDDFDLKINAPTFEVRCQIRHKSENQYYAIMFTSNRVEAIEMFGTT